MNSELRFPAGFRWGTATAGHQIEGGNEHSNWWAWEQEGKVNDGTRSGRACDYWNRYAEDHDLMVDLGHQMFRLGIEWARLEPRAGHFDEEAKAHYVGILRDLRSKGLGVSLTLNHWVLPQWLAARGGWCDREALNHWGRFLRWIVPALGPHVDLWVTLNEPMVPVLAGYLGAYHPPCKANPWLAAKVFRRLLEAHAMAYHLVHDLVPTAPDGRQTQVGFAGAYQLFEPFHESGPMRWLEGPAARLAAHVSFRAWDRSILAGRAVFPAALGGALGREIPGLRGSVDYVGVNYYMRISLHLGLAAISNVAADSQPIPEGVETTEMGWQVYPPGFHRCLMEVWERFGKPIYITENGCCENGDAMRRRYLLTHLREVQRASVDGADIRGYLLWSFMDNFEWREGFQKRFGIVAVDHDDPALTRRPRESAQMYREIIEANAITPGVVEKYSPGAL